MKLEGSFESLTQGTLLIPFSHPGETNTATSMPRG